MTNEQLVALRRNAEHFMGCPHASIYAEEVIDALDYIDALTARVAELEAQCESSAFRVGNLVTINQDEYPDLGGLFVQLWDGDSVAARVYGNSRDELQRRIAVLNTAKPQAVAVPDGPSEKPLRMILGDENWAKLRNKAYNPEQASKWGSVYIEQACLRQIFDHFEPRRAMRASATKPATQPWQEDTSDWCSRIAVAGQNGESGQ